MSLVVLVPRKAPTLFSFGPEMENELKINYFKAIQAKAKVIDTKPIYDWFNLITSKNEYTERVIKARSYEKGTDEYNYIKKNEVPCIAPNFLFNKEKLDFNIISGTGLIFFDVDDTEFEINTITDKNYFAYYKSFGGNGYSVLAKVSGLTPQNFKYNYIKIAKQLGIEDKIDLGAFKAGQYNVLSFDPNLKINEKSISFIAEENKEEQIKLQSIFNQLCANIEDSAKDFIPLRFDNANEKDTKGESYLVDWDGWDYVKCYFNSKKKLTDGRKRFILSYCRNLVWLNPHMSKERCFNVLYSVNLMAFEKQLIIDYILSVIDTVYLQKEKGTLTPKLYHKKRKFAFNQELKMSKDEKMEIVYREMRLKKKNESTQKIYDIIESWDFETYGKISGRKISNNFPISKKTVEKYYFEFKEHINELNFKNKK